jgi:predicted HNH restriction endonuclease
MNTKWRRDNPKKAKAAREVERQRRLTPAHRKALKEKRSRLRSAAIKHYGGKCVCCGETNFGFLTFDHVNNDGYIERRKLTLSIYMFKKLIKNKRRKDLRILCYNCNCGRAHNNGVCPHES